MTFEEMKRENSELKAELAGLRAGLALVRATVDDHPAGHTTYGRMILSKMDDAEAMAYRAAAEARRVHNKRLKKSRIGG